jgi:hypothetical protein
MRAAGQQHEQRAESLHAAISIHVSSSSMSVALALCAGRRARQG